MPDSAPEPSPAGPRVFLSDRLGVYVVQVEGAYWLVDDRQGAWRRRRRRPFAGDPAALHPLGGRAAAVLLRLLGVVRGAASATELLAEAAEPRAGLRLVEPPVDAAVAAYRAAEQAIADASRAVEMARRMWATAELQMRVALEQLARRDTVA